MHRRLLHCDRSGPLRSRLDATQREEKLERLEDAVEDLDAAVAVTVVMRQLFRSNVVSSSYITKRPGK